MICPVCRKEFTSNYAFQIYCSSSCSSFAQYHFTAEEKREFSRILPSFNCRCCGRTVVPEKGDRRTVFCSKQCEKKYWRHPKDYKTGTHIVFIPKEIKE